VKFRKRAGPGQQKVFVVSWNQYPVFDQPLVATEESSSHYIICSKHSVYC